MGRPMIAVSRLAFVHASLPGVGVSPSMPAHTVRWPSRALTHGSSSKSTRTHIYIIYEQKLPQQGPKNGRVGVELANVVRTQVA